MLARKLALKNGLGILILVLGGMGLLNVFCFQMALPALAIAPGTPTALATMANADSHTSTGTGFIKQMPPVTPTPQTYIVQADDNIFLIAQKKYGDSSKFTFILKANNLSETFRLVPGMALIIPYLATPTLTTTPTPKPSATVTPGLPTTTATMIPTATPVVGIKAPKPDGANTDTDQVAIMAMLTAFTTSTLVGSSIICVFLAMWVYSSARRTANQQRMARRVRPPLKRG